MRLSTYLDRPLIDCGADAALKHHLEHFDVRRLLLSCGIQLARSLLQIFDCNLDRRQNALLTTHNANTRFEVWKTKRGAFDEKYAAAVRSRLLMLGC